MSISSKDKCLSIEELMAITLKQESKERRREGRTETLTGTGGQRKGLKADLINNPPECLEVVWATDTNESGYISPYSGEVVWDKLGNELPPPGEAGQVLSMNGGELIWETPGVDEAFRSSGRFDSKNFYWTTENGNLSYLTNVNIFGYVSLVYLGAVTIYIKVFHGLAYILVDVNLKGFEGDIPSDNNWSFRFHVGKLIIPASDITKIVSGSVGIGNAIFKGINADDTPYQSCYAFYEEDEFDGGYVQFSGTETPSYASSLEVNELRCRGMFVIGVERENMPTGGDLYGDDEFWADVRADSKNRYWTTNDESDSNLVNVNIFGDSVVSAEHAAIYIKIFQGLAYILVDITIKGFLGDIPSDNNWSFRYNIGDRILDNSPITKLISGSVGIGNALFTSDAEGEDAPYQSCYAFFEEEDGGYVNFQGTESPSFQDSHEVDKLRCRASFIIGIEREV